jgi:hypothetical protein
MTTRHTSAASIDERRIGLHESAAQDLRRGNHRAAAHTIRRLLMTLPPDHAARCDLLKVLAYAESHQPTNTTEEQS